MDFVATDASFLYHHVLTFSAYDKKEVVQTFMNLIRTASAFFNLKDIGQDLIFL